jgi:hypothetical protein
LTLREKFIEDFVREFLASWAGSNYNEYCVYGRSGDLVDFPPLEDAEFIAQEIYNKLHRNPTRETPCSRASREERIARS